MPINLGDKMQKNVKKMTLNNVATKVDKLSGQVGKLETKTDKLESTVITLTSTVNKLATKTDKLETTVDRLAIMVAEGFSELKINISALQYGQEEIITRLDNTAYRFEVKDLAKRVDRLEEKAGIKK